MTYFTPLLITQISPPMMTKAKAKSPHNGLSRISDSEPHSKYIYNFRLIWEVYRPILFRGIARYATILYFQPRTPSTTDTITSAMFDFLYSPVFIGKGGKSKNTKFIFCVRKIEAWQALRLRGMLALTGY